MIGRSIAHYRISAKLGEGGMGEVWRATDARLGRDVALKILPPRFTADPERLARFEREAKLLASLNHPGIAQIYGLEEGDGVRALALELIEGPTLADRLAEGAIAWRDALPLFRELAEALAFAHERGIVHRDLKPSNIKLAADGRIKVLDFGLAKALDPLADASGMAASSHSPTLMHSPTLTVAGTELGVILGTAAYMSPEQARGRPADKRADVWGYGVVLFESLSGRQLFDGETVSDTLAAVLRKEIPWSELPAETPAPLRRLLKRCLERDPKRRLHDLSDARADLEEAESANEAATATTLATAPARRRLAPALVALAGVVAGTLLAVGWMRVRRPPAPRPTPLHFEILPPDGTIFDFSNGPVKFSADGRSVVYHVLGDIRREEVFVRALGGTEAKPVPGSISVYDQFWSPDGRSIGYFADAGPNLMRVDLDPGSTPTTLTKIRDGRGATWSPRGVIVFAPNFLGPLLRIPADGGDAVAVTTLDESAGEIAHIRPVFLPDGEHFLFHVQSELPRRSGAALATLAGGKHKLLLPLDTPATYAAGQLLFLRGGSLFAQSLDLDRQELRGEPVALAAGIGIETRYANRAFDASPGLLAYHPETEGLGKLSWLDRAGRHGAEVGRPGDRNLDISRDGSLLAVNAEDPANGTTDVWTIDLARGIRSRLTTSDASEFGPVWSPDAKLVYFGRNERTESAAPQAGSAPAGAAPAAAETASGKHSIRSRRANGLGDEAIVYESSRGMEPVAVSPDGRWLLFETGSPATRGDLEMLALDGSREVRPFAATPAHEESGRFSPDGRHIAYLSGETGQLQVYVQPWPPTGERWQVSGGGGTSPRWSADGKELFYITRGRDLVSAKIETRPQFSVGSESHLFTIPGIDYVAAPDGRFLFVTEVDTSQRTPIHVLVNWTSLLPENP